MKWQTRASLSSLKLPIVEGGILLNHTLAAPFTVVGKALHIISFGVFRRFIRLLNDSIWSHESFELSNESSCGNLNFCDSSKSSTAAIKSDVVCLIIPSKFPNLFLSLHYSTRPFVFFMFWNSSSILLGHLVPSEWSFLRLSSSLLLCFSLFTILGGAMLLLCLSSSFCLVNPSTLVTRVQIYSSIWFEELWSIERTKNLYSRLKHWFQICPSHWQHQTNDAWNCQYVICPMESTSSLDACKIKERI